MWSWDESDAVPLRFVDGAWTEVPGAGFDESDGAHARGGTLLWDGEVVPLPNAMEVSCWTTPWGERFMAFYLVFENGWHVDARVGTVTGMTLAGENVRARQEREAAEEAGTVESFVGDGWDFSHEKTGYSNPGAYVQWAYVEDGLDPVDDPFATVPDRATLERRIAFVAHLPSDPIAAASYAR